MTVKRRWARVWMAVVAISASGCSWGLTEDPVAASCGNPVRGSRYAVCGRLATAGVNAAAGAHRIIGSVDSTHGEVKSKYQLVQGTFHAHP